MLQYYFVMEQISSAVEERAVPDVGAEEQCCSVPYVSFPHPSNVDTKLPATSTDEERSIPPPTFVPYGLGFGSIPSDYYAHEECVTHFGIDHECSGTSKTYDDVKVSIKTTSSICIFMLHMLIAVIAMQRCV